MSGLDAPIVAFRVDSKQFTAGNLAVGVSKDGRRFSRPAKQSADAKAYMLEIKRAAAEAMGDRPVLTGPLRLDVSFFKPRPKNHRKASGGLSAAGERQPWPDARPDADKLVRNICDRMKGIVYQDDGQICGLVAWKHWGDRAYALIEIRQL